MKKLALALIMVSLLIGASCTNSPPELQPLAEPPLKPADTYPPPLTNATILLAEDFNDGVAQSFQNEGQDWKVVAGKYTTDKSSISTVGNIDWQDYSIEADFINPKEGALVVRAIGDEGVFFKIADNSGELYFWWSIVDGSNATNIGFDPLGISSNESLRVKLEVRDNTVFGYVNGELVGEHELTHLSSKGKAGLWLGSQPDQYWDNVIIYGVGTPVGVTDNIVTEPAKPDHTPVREAYETSVPFKYTVYSYGDEAWYEDESNKGKQSPDLWFEWVNVTNLDSEGGVFTVTFLIKFGDISKKYSTSEFISSGETKKIKSEGHKQIATGGFTFSVTPPTRTVIAYRDVPSDPSQTPTPQQVTLNKNDFLITVNSPRQVTLTNNSQITVEVYKFSMTYDFYSYIAYNMPGRPSPDYGPIVTDKLESDELAQLKQGQSFPKIFSRNDIVAIRSCSFYVKANGQELVVTYGK